MSGILDRLPFELKNCCAVDFYLADEGYYTGQVAATSKARKSYWDHWNAYVRPLGVDPYLQDAPYIDKVRVLTGFAVRVRGGGYGRGQRVQTSTVSTAVTAVGQTISLACGTNPTKIAGSDKMIPRLQQILDGWCKGDPPTKKQLPVEADVPEYLVGLGRAMTATELDRAVGDLVLIAFYYLLRIREYTVKGRREETKQMVHLKWRISRFFGITHWDSCDVY